MDWLCVCARTQNGRTPRDLALEYDKPEIVALIDAEVHLRSMDELASVTHKVSLEWNAIVKSKVASMKK